MKKTIAFLLLYPFIFLSLSGQQTLTKEWENSINDIAPSNSELPKILVDREENIFICSESHQTGIDPFIVTTKLDSSGNIQWRNTYKTFGADNELLDAALDTSGNVIIAGSSFFGDSQGLVIKYNSQGDTLWTIQNPNSSTGIGSFRDILIDDAQNIYALGYRQNSTTDPGIPLYLMKISPDGTILWENIYTATESGFYIGHQIKLLSDRIVVFATKWLTSGGLKYVIHQIDYSGQDISTIEKPYTDNFSVYSIIDQEGSIFLGNDEEQYKVTKLNLDGDTLWEFNEPVIGINIPNNPARLSELQSDGAGGVYASGLHWREESSFDILTTHLSPLGIPIWSQRFTHQGNAFDDGPLDIFVDDKYFYVVGVSQNSFFNYDYILIVYNKETGEEIASARHDRSNFDGAMSVFVQEENIYITGLSFDEYSDDVTLTLKYRLDHATHTLDLVPLPSSSVRVFPMPFSEIFNIEQKEENLLFTQFEVFDIKGVLVFQKTITDGLQKVSIPNLSKGNYLLKMIGKDKEHTQIIVKQ